MSAALIIGAGDATGGAIAKAFAAEGYTACVNRRTRHAAASQQVQRHRQQAERRPHHGMASNRERAGEVAHGPRILMHRFLVQP